MGGRDRAAHELGRVREPETGNRKLEKDAEGRREGGAEEEERYLWSSRKQQGSCARAFHDRAAAKLKGEDGNTEIIYYISII
jgi:hypothetical protein